MFERLQLARQRGISKLKVESDSKVLVDLVNTSVQGIQMHTLVKRIRNELQKNWKVQVIHIYREGNRCAD